MQQIRIDFDNPGLPQSLGAVEGESQSRIFQAALYKSGAAYTAPAGAVYSIMYRGFGPQNQGWYDTIEDGAGKRAACTVSGNVVTCELARQALRVPGHLTVVLCLTDAKGYMLKSWPIMADVRNDGYEDTGESEMYFNLSGIAGNYLSQLEKAMADAETTRNNLISTFAQVKKDIDAKAAETLKTIPESYTELDGSVKQLTEDIVNQKTNFDNAITHYSDLLNGLTYTLGYTYSRTATTKDNYSADSNGAIFPLISIIKGTAYKYTAIRPYFSSVLYENGIRLDFYSINGGASDGSFVASDNGTLFLSVIKADIDNVHFFDGDVDEEEYVINKLIIKDSNITKDNIIHVGSTRKIKGVIAAINKSKDGDTIIFDAENFDIAAELGDDWLNNYTYDSKGYGFYLGGGKTLIFPYGATVKFNYTGKNAEVNEYFSPINAGAGDYTIIGLHLSASNCRYCVHDERATNENIYHHNYIDCHFEMDNSSNPNWDSKQCIGGGLGVNGKINIDNCVFNSASGVYDVSYHNSASENAKSFVAIRNSWFENSARFSWYGQSQRNTMILFSGNSVNNAITVSAEGSGSGSPYKNIIVKQWNNEIRSIN